MFIWDRVYITKQIAFAALLHIPMVGMIHYMANTPYGAFVGEEKTTLLLRSAPFPDQIKISAVMLVMVYVGMLTLSSCINIGWLMLGLSEVKDCRPFMGSLSAGYTVRNAWS